MLASNNEVWNVLLVLNVLHSFINKSNIKLQLEVTASGGDPDSVAGEFGRHSLYKMLGYYSMIGLLRLHSLFGDYYLAIKVLENIDMHKKVCILSIKSICCETNLYNNLIVIFRMPIAQYRLVTFLQHTMLDLLT